MATYFADFVNDTDRTWTMAVYQELPNSIGLDSVSWKQTTVPTSGESGVTWEVLYNVALADYVQTGGIGVYAASQILSAQLGSAWDIVFEDNVQQLQLVGSAPEPDQILINNVSGILANPGIGMSDAGSVYKRDVNSGASAQFEVTPTYWAGLFNNVELGEVISSNVIVGPVQLQYPSGNNRATLTASLDGDNIVLDVSYSSSTSLALSTAERRITSLQSMRDKLAA